MSPVDPTQILVANILCQSDVEMGPGNEEEPIVAAAEVGDCNRTAAVEKDIDSSAVAAVAVAAVHLGVCCACCSSCSSRL